MSTPSNQTDEPKVGGEFFTLSLNKIDSIVRLGGSAPEVMAYLVLVRGAGSKSVSHWGANACTNYTPMTYRKAEQAIQWLQDHHFIQDLVEQGSKSNKAKWHIERSPDDIEVALANALVEGVGRGKSKPPLKRLDDLTAGTHRGINAARLDTLMVLLHLYRHHLLADYGGIDPSSGLYRQWESTDGGYREAVTPIEGTNCSLYEIVGGQEEVMSLDFEAEAMFYVDDQAERSERFQDAFRNLKSLGWLYETTQIWTSDPSKDPQAEPFYTLYVHDRHMKDQDPYLSREIHKAAFRAGLIDRAEEFSEFSYEDELSIKKSGRFRYIAPTKNGGHPIGIFRLKFRPHTQDTGKGMATEKIRVRGWQEALRSAI